MGASWEAFHEAQKEIVELRAEVERLRSRITVDDTVSYRGSEYVVEAVKKFPHNDPDFDAQIKVRVRLEIDQDAPRKLKNYDGWVWIEELDGYTREDPS